MRNGMKKSLIQRTPDGKYKMLVIRGFHWVLPSPYRPQNIEKKEAGKILPRKIWHPRELEGKIFHSKDLPALRDSVNQTANALPSRSDNWPLATDNCFSKSFFGRTLGAPREETRQPSPRPS